MTEPLTTGVGAYWLLDDENDVIEAIQNDFLALAQPLVGEGEGFPLRAAYIGEPTSYGDLFPAWIFYRVTTAGNSRLAEAEEKMLAAEYICQILVLDRATTPPDSEANSGRGFAEETTRKGFSAWITALANAHDVHARSTGINRRSTASGSHSEFGRPMFVDEARNVLWAHSADIRVLL